MWKFKPFAHKEQNGLEGRLIEIGSFKVQVRNVIAEGGFSCVYSARDVSQASKQYALKHLICNNAESLELVMKEISVMKKLKGHPNIVTLHAHAIFDMGRTKEALLLMEYCEKSLVNVLDSRGAGFYEEKQALAIFRDICNAVFAMHCQTPPIAHRDLKAENLLLGCNGVWKLCDFGSTSTNHKRFEKPEEMGVEEDIIRKYTTPAYRAPEMCDLLRRETINEKVDIWALGCVLYRICYLKLAFDGESKLQVLNGNYRIPDLPKYNKSLTDLIRHMLQTSPDDRPDITQVWFRVNDILPESMQKPLPDRPPEMPESKTDVYLGMSSTSNKTSLTPHSPLPPPDDAGALGAFWSSQYARDSEIRLEKTPQRDDDISEHRSSPNGKGFPERAQVTQRIEKNPRVRSISRPSDLPIKEINLFPDVTPSFQNDVFRSPQKQEKEKTLEAEVDNLKKQLAHVSAEKTEITTKYEKLAAICKSQRQEIQELKLVLAARTPSPSRDSSDYLPSPKEKIEGTVFELQQALFDGVSLTPSPEAKQWNAFGDDDHDRVPVPSPLPTKNAPKSVRTKSNNQIDSWAFESDGFKVLSSSSSKITGPVGELNVSQSFGEIKRTENKFETQPAGWAAF